MCYFFRRSCAKSSFAAVEHSRFEIGHFITFDLHQRDFHFYAPRLHSRV